MTVGRWCRRWLDSVPPSALRPRSRVRYEHVIANVWMRDPIARVKLAELTRTHVLEAMSRQERAGASPATIATNLTILRVALRAAVLDGRMTTNAAALVKRPETSARPIDPPTGADLERLFAAIAGDPLEAVWSLALGAGLRHGEVLALRWRDVDLAAGIVRVAGTLEYGSDRVGPTKSRHGARELPVPPWVADALRRHHDREPGVIPAPGAWLFHTRSGRPLHARNVLRRWHRLCVSAGVKRYRMHDLRHAAATALLAAGWPLATVSRYIGHATIAQTVDVYGHPTFDGLRFPEPTTSSRHG
jgi:integrase